MEDLWGYLGFGYMGVGLLLIIRMVYLGERLLRHIDRQYPEEAPLIRTCERTAWPWSEGYMAFKALIERESANDLELERRAEGWKRAKKHFFVWCAVFTLFFAASVGYTLLRRRWG